MEEQREPQRDSNGRFVKGGVGNPNGRPTKDKSISSQLSELLQGPLPKDDARRCSSWRVARALIDQTIKGNSKMAKILLDRAEGPMPTNVAVTGPITLLVKEDR